MPGAFDAPGTGRSHRLNLGVLRLYRNIGAGLVRASVQAGALDLPAWPDLNGTTGADLDQWRDWLRHMWVHPGFAEALEVASPAFAARIQAICQGHTPGTRQSRRAVESVIRYVLRFEHRATPFGLFAGIAPAAFGTALSVRWGPDHRAFARVDAVWLAQVTAELESCPDLLARLPVVADGTAFVRGGKLIVPFQQPPATSTAGPSEVSVRHTGAVALVRHAAQSPVLFTDLAQKLTAQYPDTEPAVIDALLHELVARRILITALRAPMTATDPLGHLTAQLAAADARGIEAAAPAARRLDELHQALAGHNSARPIEQRAMRAAVSRSARELSPVVEQPLMVDLHCDGDLVLPQSVAREAERAAAVLARLTPYPSGSLAWQEYHMRFLERYGVGAQVPVRELVDGDVGLGFPGGYRSSLLEPPVPHLTARDEQLLALAQRAALDQVSEVVLGERDLALLSPLGLERSPMLPHVELCFTLHAPTRTALERGAFDLLVVGACPAAGSTTGRFLDLLDTTDRDAITAAYRAVPTGEADALLAQVSSPPLRAATENVARSPAVWPHVISLAEHSDSRDARTVSLDDLAVSGDAARLRLVSLSQGRAVEACALNAVESVNFTHPLARFLTEVSRARSSSVAPFSWGAARRLPFRPRLRYGRTILITARWWLAPGDLAAPDASWAVWERSLERWRERMRVPSAIELGDTDQRLHLDLDHSAHRRLLRQELDRGKPAVVREAPPADAYGWFDGRAHEITTSLAATQQPAARPAARPVAVDRDHGHLPGSDQWLYVKLYGHPDRQPEILTAHLDGLWEGWGEAPQWWFARYLDPDHHLRLRIRPPYPGALAALAEHITGKIVDLRNLGLVGRAQWDTYFPETGRYGSGATMTAAEDVFAADSRAAITQLRAASGTGAPHPQAVAAAGLLNLAISFTGGIEAGTAWVIEHLHRSDPAPVGRDLHDQTVHLADPRDDFAALRATPAGPILASAWTRRHLAVRAYRERIDATDGPDPDTVLASLLHMHHIRVFGINTDCERTCYRLARTAALSWHTRHRGATR